MKGDDGFTALVNNEGLPQLRISTRYRRLLDRRSQDDADTRAYVREKFRSALWLLKSIDQRQQTIQKVADSIVKFQLEFLENGIADLVDSLTFWELDEVKFKQRDFYRLQQVEHLHRTKQLDKELNTKW